MRTIFYIITITLAYFIFTRCAHATAHVRAVELPTDLSDMTIQQDSTIVGQVLDAQKIPLVGVTVTIKGTDKVVYTDQNGFFRLTHIEEKVILVFTYIGHRKKELVGRQKMGAIVLTQDEHSIEEVVVSTGMFTRKASSFTGATATFSGEELRRVGSINVIESLRSLDPSFILLDNNAMGSNPNQTYQIQVRGQTSISSNIAAGDQFQNDPNQPLFILDGMEVTLTQIVNLDITRIASVTILKDAASTALYGSKAANGVLVVETNRPIPGQIQVAYNATAVLEVPDLRSYNMMNAAELLEFQRLSGLYDFVSSSNYLVNTELYNSRLQEVNRGVNSYWLSEPLQTTFNVRHSLNISGGDNSFTYSIGGGYRNDEGVMIGSNNSIADGNITFTYRKGKINVSNMLTVYGETANNSPYGSFSDYVDIPPYYRKTDELGNLNTDRYLEEYLILVDANAGEGSLVQVPNPLYNATLNSRDRTTSQYFSNNFSLLWDILPSLRMNASMQYSKLNSEAELYIPSENTTFDNTDVLERGSYTVTYRDETNYQGNVGLTYNKVFNGDHIINANFQARGQQTTISYLTTEMVGFPAGVEPVPNFSIGYAQNASASGYEQVARSISWISSANYSYKNKYNLDATFNIEGANNFGSNNLYTPIWALGVGWNLENEEFLNLPIWVNQLRIRGNYGYNGNQSFGQFNSTSTYIYHSTVGTFGQGLEVSEVGNPNLGWQKTGQLSITADAVLFDRRLTILFSGYDKTTDPLITSVALPTSNGVSSYWANVGGLKSIGLEYNVQGQVIRNDNTLLTLGIFGSVLKNTYFGLSNRLSEFNTANQESNALQRFYDGYSPDDLWAVRSVGIDPATGNEVFLTADGRYTTEWNADDEVVVGNARPVAEGVFNANLTYKGFRLGAYIRYQIQQSAFNSAVFERVENITNLDVNQDRRALYDRWQSVGDVSSFRAISNTSDTQMSSRFIQQESVLSGESLSAGYDFVATKDPWINKFHLSSLRTLITANNIFRLSNIQVERGLDYPFSRTITLTLNAYF